ncbi:unnamed protein product [Brachionus calyciflorus]|uniref:WD repeat-containing protein 48 homolog n=1 Tax=Brachionus calyciflorus TaxID=104777 RepID=A0A813PLZ1_9BILA|nr:unnamed protein product [Brachionus calyciflorus]
MDNKNLPKKKTQLSIIIRDPVEKLNRSGINCLKYEKNSSRSNLDRLYTAGRDSNIRVYANLNPHTSETNKFDLNNVDQCYQMSLSSHTDWVNDIIVCKNTNTLFSASSDTTVKIWNTNKGNLLTTLRNHKDYVKCLAYARDKQILASAGFDKNIYLWDVSTGTSINSADLDVNTIDDNKYSIYSLAINNQASILASGSPENCIRLWDPRTNSKLMKLKGHTHNIRYLALNRDGTQCISASSDHTIRLWSLGQQRCISTIEIHTEGVWTLCVNESFNKVYSGGKDFRIYATDLRNPDDSVLVCEENNPVLSIDFGSDQESLWVSTTSSTFKNWSLKPNNNENRNYSSSKNTSKSNDNNPNLKPTHNDNIMNKSGASSVSSSFLMQQPINTNPSITIPGTYSIKQYHILNDKRYIVTKDSDDNICVWDVLQARKLESLGKENFENAIKVRQRFISVPNWFTVDLKLGVLTINFDENDWQSAWINFKDMDSNHVRQTQNLDLTDSKINYGFIFLESIFKTCPFLNPNQQQTCSNVIMPQNSQQSSTPQSIITKDSDTNQAGLLRFNIPDHTPIIFSEVAGRTLHRLEVRDLNKESEQQILSNIIPSWIVDALLGKTAPKLNRVNFVLNPHNQNQKIVNKDRLSSIDLLQVKKLKEHVYSKILKLDQNGSNETQNDTNNNFKTNELSNANSNSGSQVLNDSQDISQLAQRTIELICSDQILSDPEMNLRTIKHLIWKGTGDLTILYRQK